MVFHTNVQGLGRVGGGRIPKRGLRGGVERYDSMSNTACLNSYQFLKALEDFKLY